jgi:hypothetical protein
MLGLLFALSACSATRPTGTDDRRNEPPTLSEPPAIQGVVTALAEGSLRIEAVPADESGSAKAVVRLTATTEIRHADGRRVGADALRLGRRVRAWFTGTVMESYPVQATGQLIVIDFASSPAAP